MTVPPAGWQLLFPAHTHRKPNPLMSARDEWIIGANKNPGSGVEDLPGVKRHRVQRGLQTGAFPPYLLQGAGAGESD